ncbi:MAG: STAS domain-containing protein [Ignavibacterium sp.]|uniref:Anti-sigma factor antagonist n=1 Tax=Ignavibacterium album TaxID=591197 RepID=A0A7V3E5I6_9BACT|nr:STAS domain-containing protein [Ignavibacterium album]MCA2004213.1 STAS domain-containing protein [Ignavibacterium sp.]MCX8105240.1 STAS domain-containing protein [Ignavibacterium album]
MNYEKRKIGDVTVFKLNESRLDTNISGLLKGEFTKILKVDEVKKFVIDLSQVESCDSSGLSAILVANRIISTTDGQIRLASPNEKVLALIRITQLDRVLPVTKTVEEAIEQLK